MIRFNVLGTTDLRTETGQELRSVLVQPKRTAILAYLAFYGPDHFHRRDKLTALFWPELDQARARAALRQSIYVLKRSGVDAVVSRGQEEIGLRDGVLDCDVVQFKECIERNEPERALELYKGDLLEGVHVTDAPEFDHWLDDARSRLRTSALEAAWKLVERADAAGDARALANWARKALALSPEDEEGARRALAALERLGAFGTGIALYTDFARSLEQRFGIVPDRSANAIAARLKERRDNGAVAADVQAKVSAPTPTGEPINGDSVRPPSAKTQMPLRRTLAGFAVVGVAVIGMLTMLPFSDPSVSAPPRPRSAVWRDLSQPARVIVFPFSTLGPEADSTMGDAAAMLLRAALDGSAGIRIVGPRGLPSPQNKDLAKDLNAAAAEARNAGADFFMLGQLVQSNGTIRMDASLYSVADARDAQAAADATGAPSQLMAISDSIVLELLTIRGSTEPGMLVPAASRSTRSLAAFKSYLDGERKFRQGRYGEAMTAFRAAVATDSTFALAYYRLANVGDWAAIGFPEDAIGRARAFAANLPERERLLVQAYEAWERGAVRDAERQLRYVLTLYGDDPEAGYLLGEVIFHSGGYVGHAPASARPFFARVAAREPDNVEALAHLARVEVHEGAIAAADSLAARVRSLRPQRDRLVAELMIMMKMARGEIVELRPDWAMIRPADIDLLMFISAWRLAAYTGNMEAGRKMAQDLAARTTDDAYRMRARVLLAQYAANQGRFADAVHECADAKLGANWGLAIRAYYAALPLWKAPDATLRAYADSLEQWTPSPIPPGMPTPIADAGGVSAQFVAFPKALVALRLQDTTTALRHARTLANLNGDKHVRALGNGLASGIRAEVAWARGDRARALVEFDRSMTDIPLQYRLHLYGGFSVQRWRRAELLAEMGRHEDAMQWYNTFNGGDSEGDIAFHSASARRRRQAPT